MILIIDKGVNSFLVQCLVKMAGKLLLVSSPIKLRNTAYFQSKEEEAEIVFTTIEKEEEEESSTEEVAAVKEEEEEENDEC